MSARRCGRGDGKPIGLIAVIGRNPPADPALAKSVLKLVWRRAAGELVRFQADEAIQVSEQRYRSYIELTGQLAWTTNAAGEVTEDLPAWRRYTGQTAQEMAGSGWAKALHPDDAPRATAAWLNVVTTGVSSRNRVPRAPARRCLPGLPGARGP